MLTVQSYLAASGVSGSPPPAPPAAAGGEIFIIEAGSRGAAAPLLPAPSSPGRETRQFSHPGQETRQFSHPRAGRRGSSLIPGQGGAAVLSSPGREARQFPHTRRWGAAVLSYSGKARRARPAPGKRRPGRKGTAVPFLPGEIYHCSPPAAAGGAGGGLPEPCKRRGTTARHAPIQPSAARQQARPIPSMRKPPRLPSPSMKKLPRLPARG